MSSRRADILMITHKSSGYLDLSLPRLLETCGPDDRVWLWHNGGDQATLDALQPYLDHPKVARFHHSPENLALRTPTQWLWANSEAAYLSKVDDDCLVSPGWIDTLAAAHEANSRFGVIGSWRGLPEDFLPGVADRKIQQFEGGHELMVNLWVQGSAYLLKHSWQEVLGTLRPEESFTGFCIRLARAGAINGFYYPFIFEDHMDDPRSPHTLITSDEALRERMPLSARVNNVTTVAQWTSQLRQSAELLQEASLDPRQYEGWRQRRRNAKKKWAKIRGKSARW